MCVGGVCSSRVTLSNCSVLHGSVIRPLLFLVSFFHIIDMKQWSDKFSFKVETNNSASAELENIDGWLISNISVTINTCENKNFQKEGSIPIPSARRMRTAGERLDLTISGGVNYASPSSGEAYRDRQLTTNFELNFLCADMFPCHLCFKICFWFRLTC